MEHLATYCWITTDGAIYKKAYLVNFLKMTLITKLKHDLFSAERHVQLQRRHILRPPVRSAREQRRKEPPHVVMDPAALDPRFHSNGGRRRRRKLHRHMDSDR